MVQKERGEVFGFNGSEAVPSVANASQMKFSTPEVQPGAASVYAVPGLAPSLLSNRVSFCLGLVGPSLTVDTACSSSLVALDIARRSHLAGTCRQAVVAGVNVMLRPAVTKLLCQARMLSPDSRCKAFDISADGYGRSEGIVAVVVMTPERARELQHPVLGWIVGSAVNHGGKAANLVAPNMLQQQYVIEKALNDAKLSPEHILLLEAHGTGTKLGDPIEVAALKRVFASSSLHRQTPLLVGSVKSNLGHTEGAAGLAGLLKAILCVNAKFCIPTVHLRTVNPFIDISNFNVCFPHALPLEMSIKDHTSSACCAGISSFGFGGTNCHVVVAGPELITPMQSSSLSVAAQKDALNIYHLRQPANDLQQTQSAAVEANDYTLCFPKTSSISWNHVTEKALNWDDPTANLPMLGRVELEYKTAYDKMQRVSAADIQSLRMTTTLQRNLARLMLDHVVQGVPVVPGAAFIEYLFELSTVATAFLPVNGGFEAEDEEQLMTAVFVESFEIERPLFLPSNYVSVDTLEERKSPRIQIESVLDVETGSCDVVSRFVPTALALSQASAKNSLPILEDETVVKHVSAVLRKTYRASEKKSLATTQNLADDGFAELLRQKAKAQEESIAAFYYNAALLGLNLGSRFKTVQRVFRGHAEESSPESFERPNGQEQNAENRQILGNTLSNAYVISELCLSDDVEPFESRFIINPAILDGAIQSASGLLISSKSAQRQICVPISGRHIHLYKKNGSLNPVRRFLSRARLLQAGPRHGLVEIQVYCEETGYLVAQINELRLQAVNFTLPVNIPKEILWEEVYSCCSRLFKLDHPTSPTSDPYMTDATVSPDPVTPNVPSSYTPVVHRRLPTESNKVRSTISSPRSASSNPRSDPSITDMGHGVNDSAVNLALNAPGASMVSLEDSLSSVNYTLHWNIFFVDCSSIGKPTAAALETLWAASPISPRGAAADNSLHILHTTTSNLLDTLSQRTEGHVVMFYGGALTSDSPEVVIYTATEILQRVESYFSTVKSIATPEKDTKRFRPTFSIIFLSNGGASSFEYEAESTKISPVGISVRKLSPHPPSAALRAFSRSLRLELQNRSGNLVMSLDRAFGGFHVSLFDLDPLKPMDDNAQQLSKIISLPLWQWPKVALPEWEIAFREGKEWVPALTPTKLNIMGPLEGFFSDMSAPKNTANPKAADTMDFSLKFRPQYRDANAVRSSVDDVEVRLASTIFCFVYTNVESSQFSSNIQENLRLIEEMARKFRSNRFLLLHAFCLFFSKF